MKATDTFRKAPWRHNCAQAVAYRWKHLYADPAIVDRYAPMVGGTAPGALCGALYAAMEACPEHRDAIARRFSAACGGTVCRKASALPGTVTATCDHCVATADTILEAITTDQSKFHAPPHRVL